MPAIAWCGRVWRISADDFVLPAIGGGVSELIGSLMAAVLVAWVEAASDAEAASGGVPPCSASDAAAYTELVVFLGASVGVHLLSAAANCVLARRSAKGRLADAAARDDVVNALTVRAWLWVLRFGLAGFGFYLAADALPGGCPDARSYGGHAVLVLIWLLSGAGALQLLWLLLSCWALWDSRLRKRVAETAETRRARRQRRFQRRCRRMFCCACNTGASAAPVFDFVADALTDFLEHDALVAVVPTDIPPALVLVRKQQRRLKKVVFDSPRRDAPVLVSVPKDADDAELPDAEPAAATEDAADVGRGSDEGDRDEKAASGEALPPEAGLPGAAAAVAASGLAVSRGTRALSVLAPSGEREWIGVHPDAGRGADLLSGRHQPFGTGPADAEELAEAAHWMEFACAIYGWMLKVFVKPSSFCRVCHCRCGKCLDAPTGRLSGGTCMHCDYHSIETSVDGIGWRRSINQSTMPRRPPFPASHTGAASVGGASSGSAGDSAAQQQRALLRKGTELVYLNLANDIVASPYLVAVDHDQRAVVVAIRGTMSLADALTDALAIDMDLTPHCEKHGLDAEGERCHKGIFDTAERIKRELYEGKILQRMLNPSVDHGDDDAQLAPAEVPSCRGYRLIVTGHSLGAGVASVLSVLLHADMERHGLHCWAFSPPGGLLSAGLAEQVRPYITSIILGVDVIPRLGLLTLYNLRDAMVDASQRCRVSKAKIMRVAFNKKVDMADLMDLGTDEVQRSIQRHTSSPRRPAAAPSGGAAAAAEQVEVGGAAAAAEQVEVEVGSDESKDEPATKADQVEVAIGSEEIKLEDGEDGKDGGPARAPPLKSYSTRGVAAPREKPKAMFVPGRVIHLVRRHKERRCGCACYAPADEFFVPTLADRLDFQEIIVSRRMLLDHLPDRVLKFLQQVRDEHPASVAEEPQH